MKQISRVLFVAIGKPFLTRLVAPAFVLLAAISFVDSSVEWGIVRSGLAEAPPGLAAVIVTSLVACWSWTAGRLLRPLWGQPTARFLIRQPITHLQWIAYLLPNTCIALLPTIFALWLLDPQINTPLYYGVFTVLAWPMVIGCSYSGLSLLLTFGGSLGLFYSLLLAYLYMPSSIYAAALVAVLFPYISVRALKRQSVGTLSGLGRNLVSRSPVFALVRRDLRGLLRTQRNSVRGLLALSALAATMALAFRHNGEVGGKAALLVATVLFSITASGVYVSIERFAAKIGKELYRRRWPISSSQRALSLVMLVGLLLAPNAVLLGGLTSTMGVVNGSSFALFSVLCILVLVNLAYSASYANVGYYMVVLLVHNIAVGLLPSFSYMVLAAGASVAMFWGTITLVRRTGEAWVDSSGVYGAA